MSADTVDDLHAAEDEIGVLRDYLRHALDFYKAGTLADGPAAVRAMPAARALAIEEHLASAYCRPSCGAEGEAGKCESEDPELCGCQCGAHDGSAPAAPRWRVSGLNRKMGDIGTPDEFEVTVEATDIDLAEAKARVTRYDAGYEHVMIMRVEQL